MDSIKPLFTIHSTMKKILVIFAILFSFQAFSQQKELTLEKAILGRSMGLYPENLSSLQWVDDHQYLYKEGDQYILKNVQNKEEGKITLADFKVQYKEMNSLPAIMNFEDNKITFQSGNSIIVYDYKNHKEINKITFNEKAANTDYGISAKSVAYTIDNNLYIATPNSPKIEVTHFKDKNIVAGQAIARFEFGISKGTFWSPQGNFLAFYQKDESNVTNYPLVDITTYPATLNNIKYPMAGQGSELAKIGVYQMESGKTIYLDIDGSDEHYLTNLSWSPNDQYIFVAEVNRGQNHYVLNMYSAATGKKIRTIMEESNDKWVEPENDVVFFPKNKKNFIWMSEQDGFKNLYVYNTKGRLKKQLTKFKFVVKSILGFDGSGQCVIISATGENPTETHTYKINLKTGQATDLTPKSGTHRSSVRGDYILDSYSSLTVPTTQSIINIKTGEEKILFTADNPLKDYKIGQTEFLTLKSKDGFDLHARIIKPDDFDPNKKYPVLVYVYGGTHAQLVTNRWLGGAPLWMHWMAEHNDYIIFTLDNRGSENRGFAFESIIHRKAGEAAMEDQLIGVDYLKSLPYIDGKRIAVHGWSYGGFMTCSLMLRQPGVFTTAVAGGPVTDWKYYEVMYGERYMDTPQENPEGYANSRIGKYLENLKGHLMLIHGSVDPTVVPQHSMTVLKEAVDKGVQLDFFTYPMHPHNVRGKDRIHLMRKVLNYISEYNQ